MEIVFSPLAPHEQETDLLIFCVFQEAKKHDLAFEQVDKRLNGLLAAQLHQDGFTGRLQEWAAFPVFGMLKAKRVAFLGLGKAENLNSDLLHKLGGSMIRRSRELKAKTVSVVLPGRGMMRFALDRFTEAFLEGVLLGSYQFHAYRAPLAPEEQAKALAHIQLCGWEKGERKALEKAAEEARMLYSCVHLTRDLVNTPSAEMTPAHLVKAAQDLVEQQPSLSLEVLDAARMQALGMEPTLAVGRGSMHPAQGAHIVYRPKTRPKKKIVFIGKAVTFDSGGLSLKQADGMMTMKIDMAGAATVLGVMKALPSLNLPFEVHGIFLGVENMPSGSAYRPGDVVRAMNGKTIEVLNTDAEGRLTLADALSYAMKEVKPDMIVDLATLTGACVIALGEEVAGLFSNDKRLAKDLLEVSAEQGESMCQLPLYQPYQDMIKSRIADLKNIGGRPAGAITAALFLSHFVDPNTPWAHIDIAGPSYAEKETRPDHPFGGTGFAVRTLVRYLQALKERG